MSTYGGKRNNTKTTNPTTLPLEFYLGELEGSFLSDGHSGAMLNHHRDEKAT
jgi:hypothetical protein